MASNCKLTLALCVSAAAFLMLDAAAGMLSALTPSERFFAGSLLRVDVRSYYHCHNTPRRTQCHKTERLAGVRASADANHPPRRKSFLRGKR